MIPQEFSVRCVMGSIASSDKSFPSNTSMYDAMNRMNTRPRPGHRSQIRYMYCGCFQLARQRASRASGFAYGEELVTKDGPYRTIDRMILSHDEFEKNVCGNRSLRRNIKGMGDP